MEHKKRELLEKLEQAQKVEPQDREYAGSSIPHHLLKFFNYDHLSMRLKIISRDFCEIVHRVDEDIPDNSEKTVALRKLLEAKDCAVRAAL